MKIQQYYLACLSHASYMITDEKTKKAAVVDPLKQIMAECDDDEIVRKAEGRLARYQKKLEEE